MRFPISYVKSVKSDVVKGETYLTFTVDMNDTRTTVEELARYCNPDAGGVVLEVTPRQIAMVMTTPVSKRFTSSDETESEDE